jgi:hypothetical protein
MMKRNFFLLVFLLAGFSAFAQDDIFGGNKVPARKGIVIGLNGGIDLPAADMASRFGTSVRVGPSFMYKTMSNWMFGVKGDFFFGNQVREDSLMYNIRDRDGSFINKNSQRVNAGLFERGYMIGLQAGKIIPLAKANPNNGLLLLTGAGFMQHKITITDLDKQIAQVSGEYKKGYDRLANGIYLEQFIGYNRFDPGGLLNFHIGLDVVAGFNQGRRNYLYDVQRPGNEKRFDLLFGIRGGLYIPVFHQKSEELYFD